MQSGKLTAKVEIKQAEEPRVNPSALLLEQAKKGALDLGK